MGKDTVLVMIQSQKLVELFRITMLTSKQLRSTLLITTLAFSSATYADWGSFFEDLTSTGEELLSTTTSDSDSTTKTPAISGLDTNTIVSGLKEALEVGTKTAVENVSQKDGYLSNSLIKIAMPPELEQASGLMKKFGMGSLADDFEQSINRAAEAAAPEATNIIVGAIKDMSIEDANKILQGSDDAATQFFKEKTSTQLTALFEPNIKKSLDEVGSTKYYNELTDQIADVPLVGETINLDLPNYVTEQALDGLFTVIAQEEKKIRENPTARTTELLKEVFSK